MATGLGDVAYFGVGEESSWGGEVARTAFFKIISETLKLNGGFNYPVVGTFGHAQRQAIKLPTFVDGDVELEVNYNGIGWLLKHLLGAVSTSQIASSLAYTHTFTPTTALPIGLSGEVDRDLLSVNYLGLKVNSLSLGQAVGELVAATFGFIGKSELKDTATAETFPTDLCVLPDHFSLELDDTAALITDWSLNINNGLSGGDRSDLGTLTLKEPVRTAKQVISGSFTAEFDDTTQYTKFSARNSVKLELLYDADTANYTIDSDQVNALHIIMPTVMFQAGQYPVSGIGPIIQEYEFQAIYDVANDTHAISIELTNGDTTYTDT